MTLTLTRTYRDRDGIFGILTDSTGALARTLEHAYPAAGTYQPIVPQGNYVCVRGKHRLKMTPTFETFEVTNVPGHSGILFHVGNFNQDSEGCILLGQRVIGYPTRMLTDSNITFSDFMDHMKGIETFNLIIEDFYIA